METPVIETKQRRERPPTPMAPRKPKPAKSRVKFSTVVEKSPTATPIRWASPPPPSPLPYHILRRNLDVEEFIVKAEKIKGLTEGAN